MWWDVGAHRWWLGWWVFQTNTRVIPTPRARGVVGVVRMPLWTSWPNHLPLFTCCATCFVVEEEEELWLPSLVLLLDRRMTRRYNLAHEGSAYTHRTGRLRFPRPRGYRPRRGERWRRVRGTGTYNKTVSEFGKRKRENLRLGCSKAFAK